VYFDMNERDLLRMMGIHRARLAEQEPPDSGGLRASRIPLFMGLANEDGHPHQGLMDFAESTVDPSTGTISLRAVFDNPLRPPVLYPGLFARLKLPVAEREDALLVRDRAVGADPSGRYLLVVDADNLVEQRPVTLGQLHDGMRVVLGGLEAGDRVVVNGLQRARPGTIVDPTEVEMAGDPETAEAAAGGNG
jgi:RND family efflux transporter MFP subunit